MDADYITAKSVALLRRLHGNMIGATEFCGGWCSERVDAILFKSRASFVIETKISRADFKADAKKPFRQPGGGVGKYRYYACPEGLIKPEELPERWGLIYIREGRQKPLMPLGYGGAIKVGEERTEESRWPRAVYDLYGTPHTEPRKIGDMLDMQRERHAFEDRCMHLETQYLYALATRYKSGKFGKNIL